MATTTSCISALQTIEAIKLLQKKDLSNYKNSFLNLAVPFHMSCEPGECETITIRDGLKTSFWTRWIVELDSQNSSLGGFMKHLHTTYGVKVSNFSHSPGCGDQARWQGCVLRVDVCWEGRKWETQLPEEGTHFAHRYEGTVAHLTW